MALFYFVSQKQLQVSKSTLAFEQQLLQKIKTQDFLISMSFFSFILRKK